MSNKAWSVSACSSGESSSKKISSHGALVITLGRVANTSPDAILSLTRTACHRDDFSVISYSSLDGQREKICSEIKRDNNLGKGVAVRHSDVAK